MQIDKDTLSKMLMNAAQSLKEQSPQLNEIDSQHGNGTHGDTMSNIANTIQNEVGAWQNNNSGNIKDLLTHLAKSVISNNGSTSASLFGTMLGGLAQPLGGGQNAIDATMLKQMLDQGIKAMQGVTNAKVGDKTMMDALIPAANASKSAPNDISQILLSAAQAALSGARNTQDQPAKYGRAKDASNQAVGTPDPGATSMSTFLNGLSKIFN